MKIPSRTDMPKSVTRAKCVNLYLKNQYISWILDDESYFTLSHLNINGKYQRSYRRLLVNFKGKVYENGWVAGKAEGKSTSCKKYRPKSCTQPFRSYPSSTQQCTKTRPD